MRILYALTICAILIPLSSCTNIFSEPENPISSEQVRIGILLPLSGERAFSGRKTLAGIFLAHDQINKGAPIRGKRIKLVIIDNKSTTTGSRQAMKTFIEKEKINILIAACSTANALAIKSIVEKSRIPTLLTLSTGNIVTERSPYMFRTCFTDSQQGKAMAVFAYKTQLYKKTGVLLDLNDQITYRRDLGRAFAAAFKKLSGENVEEMGYISGTDNFVPQMMRFRQTETAAIFAPSDIPDAGIIIKQARKCGVRKVLLGSDGWDHTELFNYCGSRPEPCYITSMFSAESDLPGVKEFVRSVKARTGKTPNTDTAQAYDTMNIVVKALKLAHSPNDIRSGLYKIGNYPGVTGKISINAQGDAVKTIFIKKIVKKKTGEFGFELIKIISPEDI